MSTIDKSSNDVRSDAGDPPVSLHNAVSAVVSIIGAPTLYDLTSPYLPQIEAEKYGPGTVFLIDFVYWALLFPAVFFSVRFILRVLLRKK